MSPCCLKQLRHKLFPLVVLVNWALNSAVLQCTRRCIFLRPFLFSITYLVCCIIILVPLTKYVSITLLILVPLVFTLFGCAIVCKFLPGALCCTGCRPSSHTTVHIGFHSVANCTVSSSSFFVFSAMKQWICPCARIKFKWKAGNLLCAALRNCDCFRTVWKWTCAAVFLWFSMCTPTADYLKQWHMYLVWWFLPAICKIVLCSLGSFLPYMHGVIVLCLTLMYLHWVLWNKCQTRPDWL